MISFELILSCLLGLISILFALVSYLIKQAKDNFELEFNDLGIRVNKLEDNLTEKFEILSISLDKKNQFIIDKLLNIAPERSSVNNSIVLIEGKIRSSLDRLEACEKKVNEILVSNKQSEVGYNKDIKILHNALMIFKNDLAKIVGQKKDN